MLNKIWLVVVLVLCSACFREPTTTQVSKVQGVLEGVEDENFNVGGWLIGNIQSPSMGLLYGVAFADGCSARIRIEGQLITKKGEFCMGAVKIGETIPIKKTVVVRVRDQKIINVSYE